jgi:hypothetical protein
MKYLAYLAALLIATSALAHGPNKGVNGGPQVDAGDYHVEIVAENTMLSVYLSDRDDKPVDTKGHRATGIFVIQGKSQRIELQPESANKLVGKSSVPLPATPTGAVQITLPTGKTVQAKFE